MGNKNLIIHVTVSGKYLFYEQNFLVRYDGFFDSFHGLLYCL